METVQLQVETRLTELRIAEVELREQILEKVRFAHEHKLWRKAGYRSLNEFCTDELGYSDLETRDLLVRLNVIIPNAKLTSENPEIQKRIDQLKSWRRRESEKRGWAAFRVISNRTLLSLAEQPPVNLEDLAKVRGIGKAKVRDFGAAILSELEVRPAQIAMN